MNLSAVPSIFILDLVGDLLYVVNSGFATPAKAVFDAGDGGGDVEFGGYQTIGKY